MAHIIVIGAGLGGLAAALFLARRGHRITIFERDPETPPNDIEACFNAWHRRGVAQARQPHAFVGLSSKVLSEEAPDVLTALKTMGAYEYEFPGNSQDYPLYGARRLVHEAALRRAAAAQPGITWHLGSVVNALIAESGAVPHVTGVRTESGEEHHAELVIDASGRWTAAAEWLSAIGARPWTEEFHETPILYLTRWYRLKPGRAFPPFQGPLNVPLNYIATVCFPADNGVFSLTATPLMSDPLRAKLMDPKLFDAFIARVPALAPWLDAGEAMTNPLMLARINNAYRRLCDAQGPIVTGFVLLGDSAIHTNPTLGRGASLAYLQAQGLARLIDPGLSDPLRFAAAFDQWSDENVGCWFADHVEIDEVGVKALEAWRKPPGPREIPFFIGLSLLGRQDPVIGEALVRRANMLAGPRELTDDPAIIARVGALIDEMKKAPPAPPAVPAGPTRAEFEALVGG